MNNKKIQQNGVTVHFNARYYWEESLEVQLIWPKIGRVKRTEILQSNRMVVSTGTENNQFRNSLVSL